MIYLDYNATSPCDPQVIQAMLPYFGEIYANPSSSVHQGGKIAASAVEQAREQVADLIGALPKEIVFTGGATESNNLAITGLAHGSDGKRKRIVTSSVEHKSVLVPCTELKKQGFEVIILPVDREGRVDLDAAEKAITRETLLVSVQAANNEIGTIQPVSELAKMARKRGALIHCDAAQGAGKIPVDVEALDVDLLSISAHKLYGPKGIGALYIKEGPYTLPVKPIVLGGGQEHNLRSGTLNVPGIVGFGKACSVCSKILTEEAQRIGILRDRLEANLMEAIKETKRNGSLNNRLPGTSSITFPGIDAEALIANTPELALSTGSACSSGAPEPSHVLLAIGLGRQEAYNTVRIGLGRFTTEEEISRASAVIIQAIARLKSLM